MTPSGSTRLLLLALTTFVLFLSTLVGTPVLPELAAELGADSGATAAILSAALSSLVVMQFFTGGLAARHGRKLVLGGAALAGGLTSLGCALAVYAQLGRVSPLLLGAGLLSLVAFPVALAVKETRVVQDPADERSEAASRRLAGSVGREEAEG